MALPTQNSRRTVRLPLSSTGHPLPRRTSPSNSVTLIHHQLARDASLRASPGSAVARANKATGSPRRNSSGDSHETGQSDPNKWFDQSNQNPTATFDGAMDVDPPFFQKESDSSNDDKLYAYQNPPLQPLLNTQHSSSADDYRSVIDDLTIEIQKLKEELKKYKQRGPDMLRKDKLFEIKYHGLPKRKRRELETTLRDFAASIEDSPDVSSSQRKKSSRHATRDNMYSGSGSASKHASSSSGSNARPVDSAYASMSSGANSAGVSLGRPAMSSRARNDQKVESYLRDIPEGLYPRHMVLTDRERKKLVVRRLEQIFTGKMGGRHARKAGQRQNANASLVSSATAEPEPQPRSLKDQRPTSGTTGAELCREARILPSEQLSGTCGKKTQSRDNASASNSNGDQTESGGHGNSSRSGTNPSPTQPTAPDQRPTRVNDLDPDRIQVPSENMDYIRHLGLVPPGLLVDPSKNAEVQPDADGWVYLNLLCNMAQLHIVNVTPSFVRAAVTEISTKFQLSSDGRKIRWRGGSDGTQFSSDSSNDSSQTTPEVDDAASKDGKRKRQRTGKSAGYEDQSGGSSKSQSKFGPQISTSSDSFHYKPLFAHNGSPNGQISLDDTLSSFGPIDDSNVDESRWGLSGSGTSNRRKRRHDGVIIYYSGAPFCTDLSGDPGDASPATYMLSSGQDRKEHDCHQFDRPIPHRSASGSSLGYRPLSDMYHGCHAGVKMDVDSVDCVPDLGNESDSDSGIIDSEFPWATGQQYIGVIPLEPCGLGGVMPDDHFMVVVTTKRPKDDTVSELVSSTRKKSEEATEVIIGRLASMSTSSPVPVASSQKVGPVEIEYVSGRIKRLAPVSLPPPVIFLPPFSSDASSSIGDDYMSEDADESLESSEELMSRQANPHHSDGYPDGVDLSSGDEDGEDPDENLEELKMYDKMESADVPGFARPKSKRQSIGSAEAAPGSARERSKSASADALFRTGASSAATAGVRSGYTSSDKEN
ncbi:uncharacterized protein UV8b_07414 [Ustilaginoidea virens]|uniref:Frequency clock protein n=1 Tax=Ustilaginoidea virens TaxID=1159556 RepID=A0A8E5HX56_USTVR|nr:uncharacterized protein UV8b_07414 [Ustilaginoidea virens]QUC23173.1 hypothetical protein UV8b_07414 [Ustilaginoidea virens]